MFTCAVCVTGSCCCSCKLLGRYNRTQYDAAERKKAEKETEIKYLGRGACAHSTAVCVDSLMKVTVQPNIYRIWHWWLPLLQMSDMYQKEIKHPTYRMLDLLSQ